MYCCQAGINVTVANVLPNDPATDQKSDNGADKLAVGPLDAEVFDPADDSRWDKLVTTHPECTAFHSAAWARVLMQSYGHTPLYLRVHRSGKTVALVPFMEVCSPITGRRGVSLPFSDLCEPLLWGDTSLTDLAGMLAKFARARRWRHAEFRMAKTIPGMVPHKRFYHHSLSLGNSQRATWDQFASSAQRAIRRGMKQQAVAQVTSSLEAIRDFFRLHLQTRRRHGVPPQPFRFFRNIHRQMIEPGNGFVVVVKANGRAIAAAVFFLLGERAVYKFAASDDGYQSFRGNNIAIWEGIRFLITKGCKVLDFGRTDIDDAGLRRFKMSWSPTEDYVCHFRVGASGVANRNGAASPARWQQMMIRNLPPALNRLAGALAYPHLD
jgi:CelD/BcsL family acetyltransferase involved in cellulose biosynthesis